MMFATPASAQKKKRKKGPTTLKGTVVRLEKKGRTLLLTVKDEADNEKEYLLNARTVFQVTGKGDSGFFRPGVTISTKALAIKQGRETNLFGRSFEIDLGKPLAPRVTQDRKAKEVFLVVGKILAADLDKKELRVDFGRAGRKVLNLETGYAVRIKSAGASLIKPGDPVELLGTPSRGDRFNVKVVTVNLTRTIKADEYFKSLAGSGKKKRRKRSKKTNKDDDSAKEKKPD